MSAISITTAVSTLQTLFNEVDEVYYKEDALNNATIASLTTVDIELPVLSGGINFDTGAADTTVTKITTGANWATKVSKGDPDISLQIASVAGTINNLFLKKKTASSVTTDHTLDGKTYTGEGYTLAPKKVGGALLFLAQNRETLIILPNVEMYASLIAADGDNPAYFNVAVTPLLDTAGCDVYILKKNAQ